MSSGLSKFCFGGEPLGGTDWGKVGVREVERAVSRAFDLGVDSFDTADVYGLGLSEKRLSLALGERRHDAVIMTKGGLTWSKAADGGRARIRRDSSPKHMTAAVEASLRRLRVQRIPVYLVHWPDPGTEIRKTFEALARLKDQGLIGALGCSNFDEGQLRAAAEVAPVEYIQLPVNLLTGGPSAEVRRACAELDVRIVAYNVLANGLLTGKFGTDTRFPPDDRRARLPLFRGAAFRDALRQVDAIAARAERSNLSAAQYAIAWVLSRAFVSSVVVGIKNVQQLEENLRAMDGDVLQRVEAVEIPSFPEEE